MVGSHAAVGVQVSAYKELRALVTAQSGRYVQDNSITGSLDERVLLRRQLTQRIEEEQRSAAASPLHTDSCAHPDANVGPTPSRVLSLSTQRRARRRAAQSPVFANEPQLAVLQFSDDDNDDDELRWGWRCSAHALTFIALTPRKLFSHRSWSATQSTQ